MEDDWDADDFVPPPVTIKNKWEGEDEVLEVVKEVKEIKIDNKAPSSPKKNKKPDNTKAATAPPPQVEEPPLDPIAQKIKNQKMVEESDYQHTQDIFLGFEKKRTEQGGELDLDKIDPKTEAEFEQLAGELAAKLEIFSSHFQYVNFLKSLVKNLATSLTKVDDCRELSSAINVVINDKLTKAKGKGAKKKPTVAAPTATAGKKVNIKEDMQVYDDDDDDDFFM